MSLTTTLELTQWVEKELGHDISTSASSQRDDIVDQLDIAHKTLLAGGGLLNYDKNGQRVREDITFNFARSVNPKVLNLSAPLDEADLSATVAATNGSNSLTFSAGLTGVNLTGWHIRIADQDEVYRISAHTADASSATLDGAFVGENVTAGSWDAYKLQYTVGSSDVLQILSPLRSYDTDGDATIDLVDKDEMLTQFPLGEVDASFPEMVAILGESAGTWTLQLSSSPKETERCELDYIAVPSTLDTISVNPIIPAHYRSVLAFLATYFLLIRNDDDRANAYLQMARDKFSELVSWNDRSVSSGDPNYGRVVLNQGFGGGVKRFRFTDVT